MRPNASVEKVYLYPKPVDFRKSIDGLAALVELDIKVAVFDPVHYSPEWNVWRAWPMCGASLSMLKRYSPRARRDVPISP
ncbi:IS66 family insertion sequence element accessory protein TnpB [Pseudomonas sp. ANT_H12B]|uniref:IS66 family insertion sequence element accessory protein TnpB n=1 Tax=Pseudomonas sp. ANT_H12B TaxID=2597348 RepID=UPI0021166155|nr:IS66 family insertion sequence element accessory protein TnpB [Pseudomonas sp. ANT_H12B]